MATLRSEEWAIVNNWGFQALQNKQHYLKILALANDIRRQNSNKLSWDECLYEAEQRVNGKEVE